MIQILRVIFSSVALLANIVSFVIFRGAGVVIIAFIKLFQVSPQGGASSDGVVEAAINFFRSGVEIAMAQFYGVLAWVASSFVSVLTTVATAFVQQAASAAVNLLDTAKTGLADSPRMLQEVMEGASDMVNSIGLNATTHFLGAMKHVMNKIVDYED